MDKGGFEEEANQIRTGTGNRVTTHDLRDLLGAASERSELFRPDPAVLVAAGRRRARNHQVALTVAVFGLVVSVSLAGLFGVDAMGDQPLPAATPNPGPPMSTELCARADDFLGTAGSVVWRRAGESWTGEVLRLADSDGATTVRRSPDGSQYAYCHASVPTGGQPAGGLDLTLIDAAIIAREPQIARFWTAGCGGAARTACYGVRASYVGRLPTGVTRVHLNGHGQDRDATVKDGFWAYRFFRSELTTERINITMYNAADVVVSVHQY